MAPDSSGVEWYTSFSPSAYEYIVEVIIPRCAINLCIGSYTRCTGFMPGKLNSTGSDLVSVPIFVSPEKIRVEKHPSAHIDIEGLYFNSFTRAEHLGPNAFLGHYVTGWGRTEVVPVFLTFLVDD
jgi:hypothetical protein